MMFTCRLQQELATERESFSSQVRGACRELRHGGSAACSQIDELIDSLEEKHAGETKRTAMRALRRAMGRTVQAALATALEAWRVRTEGEACAASCMCCQLCALRCLT